MFWGVNMKPNRKYMHTTHKSFHLSQAALHGESSHGGVTKIWISFQNQRFLLCTLRKEVCEQVMLDYNFSTGNVICFENCGSGNVTLSGYTIEEQDMGEECMYGDRHKEDSESDESENASGFVIEKLDMGDQFMYGDNERSRGRGKVIKGCQKVGAKDIRKRR